MRHCDNKRATRDTLFDPFKIEQKLKRLSHFTNIAIYQSICRFG